VIDTVAAASGSPSFQAAKLRDELGKFGAWTVREEAASP